MAHFTYEEKTDPDCLKQGDLLVKTQALSEILAQVHPHFNREEYKYFLVLTQTCDLYRSKDRSIKTKYINIAAVRPLEDILMKEAAKFSSSYLEKKTNKIFDEQKRSVIYDFVSKLLNNNATDYFYLHNDLTITEPLVAVLRVSIALKAEEHYDTCLNSKRLELENSFKAKLGWLIGNLYSRVSTEDWESYQMKKTDIDFEKMVDTILTKNYWFIKNIKATESELFKTNTPAQLNPLSYQELKEVVKHVQLKTKRNHFEEKIDEIIRNSNLITEGESRKKLYHLIISDRTIADLLK